MTESPDSLQPLSGDRGGEEVTLRALRATTILQQLAGCRNPDGAAQRLVAMIGARDFLALSEGEAGIQFKWDAKSRDGVNCVRVILDANDTYTVTFFAVPSLKAMLKGAEPRELKRIEMLYSDDLRRVFEETTGLRVKL